MTYKTLRIVAVAVCVAVLSMAWPASAQTAPSLGSAQSFAVLASSTVTNTGTTVITGDLGVSPGTSVTGFPPGTVLSGSIHSNDAATIAAQASNTAAYNALSQPCSQDFSGQDLGGKILTPGVYCFSSSAQLTGVLTLNAQGNANAVFIFRIGSALTTASSSSVVFSNGGSACNVFWQVGSSATIGTSTSMTGNILAVASVTMTTGANLTGRALARNGAVTLDTNAVTVAACSAGPLPPSPTPSPTPTPTPVPAPIPATCTATAPDLFIVKHHTTAFVAGANASYSIALFNQGVTSSSPISVTDTLPTGLTFVSASGVNWTCAAVGQVVTCTTTASAPGAGPSPNNITLTVNPTAGAVPSVTNIATVSGGGDCDTTNNGTSDVTLVAASSPIPVPTLPQTVVVVLALGLAAVGYFRLRATVR